MRTPPVYVLQIFFYKNNIEIIFSSLLFIFEMPVWPWPPLGVLLAHLFVEFTCVSYKIDPEVIQTIVMLQYKYRYRLDTVYI